MKITATTRAGRLLQIAHETYRRGESAIAQSIFVLAMDEPDADQTMDAPPADEEGLKAQLMSAMDSNDIAAAQDALDKLSEMQSQNADPTTPPDDDDDDDEPPAESQMPPGSAPDLPPAQVASLISLAKKIKDEGHPDLAQKITAALIGLR